MFGLFLIYFIGKSFYELANKFEKKAWPYVVLGIISYYAGSFLVGVVLGIAQLIFPFSTDDYPAVVWNIIALPFGVLSCWGTYKYLEWKWGKKNSFDTEETLDGSLINEP